MTIETLYDKLTLQEIQQDAAEAIKECDMLKIPYNQRRYFSTLADKYGLVDSLIEQLRTVKDKTGLTTNAEIASLFGARDYSSATLYLKRFLKPLNPKIYEIRVQLCLEEGGRRGGESCNTSPIKHNLWPKKKK